MLRFMISFVSVFVTLGGGILLTITLVRQLEAPALVFPGIVAIMVLTFVVGLLTSPGRTLNERIRWLSRSLEGKA